MTIARKGVTKKALYLQLLDSGRSVNQDNIAQQSLPLTLLTVHGCLNQSCDPRVAGMRGHITHAWASEHQGESHQSYCKRRGGICDWHEGAPVTRLESSLRDGHPQRSRRSSISSIHARSSVFRTSSSMISSLSAESSAEGLSRLRQEWSSLLLS